LSLLLEFTASREEADKYYDLRWFQIEGLARALLELEELGTRKVREIIKDAQLRWCNEHGGENST